MCAGAEQPSALYRKGEEMNHGGSRCAPMGRYGVAATLSRIHLNLRDFMPMPLPQTPATMEKLRARTGHDAAQWGAAIFILTSERFVNDDRVWRHVSHDLSGIDFWAMLDNHSWQKGPELLLRLAANLYGKNVKVDIGRLLELTGPSGCDLVLGAIKIYQAEM